MRRGKPISPGQGVIVSSADKENDNAGFAAASSVAYWGLQRVAAGNQVLYAGYRHDPETGLYHVRYRYYHPSLGRWITRDPIGYADGMSLYEYVGGRPVTAADAKGLIGAKCCYTGDSVVEITLKDDPYYTNPVDQLFSGKGRTYSKSKRKCFCFIECEDYDLDWYWDWGPRARWVRDPSGDYITKKGAGIEGHTEYTTYDDYIMFWESEREALNAGVQVPGEGGVSVPSVPRDLTAPGGGVDPLDTLGDKMMNDAADAANSLNDTAVEVLQSIGGPIIEGALNVTREDWETAKEKRIEAWRKKCDDTCAAKKGQKA